MNDKWVFEEKEYAQDELVKKMAEKFFKENYKDLKPSREFSLFEILLYPLIVKGLDAAQEKKFEKTEQTALFILGYMSARLNLDALESLFFELKTKKSTEDVNTAK